MKIWFFGDSFCATRMGTGAYKSTRSWVQLCDDFYQDAEVISHGHGGNSLFTTWKSFCDVQGSINPRQDYVIWTYTEGHRLPNKDYLPINMGSVECALDKQQRNLNPWINEQYYKNPAMWHAADQYYAHIMDRKWHDLTHTLLIDHIDDICAQINVPTLHFYCFPHSPINQKDKLFSSGPVCNDALFDISEAENYVSIAGRDERPCHFNQENNIRLFDIVQKFVEGKLTNERFSI